MSASVWAGCAKCRCYHEFATLAEAERYVMFANRCHEAPVASVVDEAAVFDVLPKPWHVHRLIVLEVLA